MSLEINNFLINPQAIDECCGHPQNVALEGLPGVAQEIVLNLATSGILEWGTYEHSIHVEFLGRKVAGRMRFLSKEEKIFFLTALKLHDLGKIETPQRILVKPGRLDEDEWEYIYRHPRRGAELLYDAGFPQEVWEIVHQHHERGDGSGYPQKLQAPRINFLAEVASVIDHLDSAVTRRSGDLMRHLREAEVEISEGSEKGYFHPYAVSACLDELRNLFPVLKKDSEKEKLIINQPLPRVWPVLHFYPEDLLIEGF